jgi:hypothetical protein
MGVSMRTHKRELLYAEELGANIEKRYVIFLKYF